MKVKVYETYSMDFSSCKENVQREDGQWFQRYQYRDPRYGYKWSPWKKTVDMNAKEMVFKGEFNRRIPKG